MAEANYARRLARARAAITDAHVDALLITSPYNRRYLTGFRAMDGDITESSGWALVSATRHALIAGTFQLSGVEDEIVPSGVAVLSTDNAQPPEVLARAMAEDRVRRLGFEKEWLSYDRYERVRGALDVVVELVPCDDLIEAVRATKDEAEIATIRRAADVADRAFAELTRQIEAGMTERQVASLLDRLMVDLGASGPSFPTIVACGPGAAQPHAVPSDRPVRAGEPLLIDFGSRVDGYCSDFTRTICIGEPDAKLVEAYGVVRAAQDAALQALQAGNRTGSEVDGAARRVIDDSPYRGALIHSVGHGVGLAVHELPALTRLRSDKPEVRAELARVERIPANAVVTNEPGVYLPGWGGVRLEDMILVTENGAEVIGSRNPEHILSVGGGR